jgi:hypothetical protein
MSCWIIWIFIGSKGLLFYGVNYRSGYIETTIDCYWSLSDFELSFMAIEDYRDKVINELL